MNSVTPVSTALDPSVHRMAVQIKQHADHRHYPPELNTAIRKALESVLYQGWNPEVMVNDAIAKWVADHPAEAQRLIAGADLSRRPISIDGKK